MIKTFKFQQQEWGGGSEETLFCGKGYWMITFLDLSSSSDSEPEKDKGEDNAGLDDSDLGFR